MISNKIFNSKSSYDDAALMLMPVPWSATGEQLTAYGPDAIIKASRTISTFEIFDYFNK